LATPVLAQQAACYGTPLAALSPPAWSRQGGQKFLPFFGTNFCTSGFLLAESVCDKALQQASPHPSPCSGALTKTIACKHARGLSPLFNRGLLPRLLPRLPWKRRPIEAIGRRIGAQHRSQTHFLVKMTKKRVWPKWHKGLFWPFLYKNKGGFSYWRKDTPQAHQKMMDLTPKGGTL